MTPRIIDCEQRSPEWFAARAGRLTGSVADAVVSKLKSGGEPAARRDLRTQLAIESITGLPVETEGFVSKDMQRGIDLEATAVGCYEAETGNMVRKTGFIIRDDLLVGCSTDGDVEDLKGILEIKCPKSATHVGYLKANRLPPEYVAQVMHNLWVTGAEFCDFVSFDDRLPEGLQYFHVRAMRADLDVAGYEAEALRFLSEVRNEVETLKSLRKAA